MRRDPILLGSWPGGFDAWKGRWKNRKRWDRAHETQPRAWSASPEAGTRPGRRRGVGPRPAPTASHHLPRGGMGGTCDPQLEGAQARAALAATSLDPSRSSAVAPVDHRAWCAEGGCAHTVRASACATTEGAGGRVSTPPACLQRSSVGRGCRITLGAAWSGSVLSSCSVLRRRRAACWQSFGGQK